MMEVILNENPLEDMLDGRSVAEVVSYLQSFPEGSYVRISVSDDACGHTTMNIVQWVNKGEE